MRAGKGPVCNHEQHPLQHLLEDELYERFLEM